MLNWTRNLFRTRAGANLSAPYEAPSDDSTSTTSTTTSSASLMPEGGALLSGRYRLEALIGFGTTSVVYRASDAVLHEPLAVKILLRKGADRSQSPADETAAGAAAALHLTHPNIARVFELERHDRWPYLVMEYLDGVDLHRHMKSTRGGRLPLLDILRIGTSCLDALSYAHGCGVVHNDVKPTNLLLTREGTVKLCDFGLARLAEDSPGAWLSASSAGAPAFMSPERIKGARSEARSDLYSVGATLYTLAVGHTLFGAEMAQAWRGHLELEPAASPFLPPPLFQVLKTALAKNPEDRYGSAAEMHAALIEAFADIDDEAIVADADDDDLDLLSDDDLMLPDEPSWRPPMAPVQPSALVSPAVPPTRPAPIFAQAPAQPRAIPAGMVAVRAMHIASKYGGFHDVKPFFIGKLPVTNAEWKRFVDETRELPPPHWLGGRVPQHKERHPVVGVSLAAAQRYAAWIGCRLPSDIEWEAAARGEGGRAFPWGARYEANRVNGPDSGRQDTVPVDAHPDGASELGCLDLVGNAWEWTDPARSVQPSEEGYAWVFGGSFRHACEKDGAIARNAVAADKDYLYLGFRCARDDGSDA